MASKIVLVSLLAIINQTFAGQNAVIPSLLEDEYWGPGASTKDDTAVKPFEIQWSDEFLNDLKYRLAHRRPLHKPLEGIAFQYGINLDYLETLLEFWSKEYNYTDRLAFLNQYPQYKTEIQGLDIHFLWVKANVSCNSSKIVLPLVLLHGWPSSVRDFYEIITMLTNKREGYEFVFDVVVPSLPGFGFSEAASRTGLGPVEIAVVMRNLMQRIGYSKFYIQGGDFGSIIGSAMATVFPNEVLGYHTNMPVGVNAQFQTLLAAAETNKSMLEESLWNRIYPLTYFNGNLSLETGYSQLQNTKPDTPGVAMDDSPSGLAAYLMEKWATGTNLANREKFDGGLSQYSKTDLIDTLMMYWTERTATTSFRLYKENSSARTTSYGINNIPTSVPTWAVHTANEPLLYPAKFMTSKYTNILGIDILSAGGHYAAFEIPDLLANTIFNATSHFLDFHSSSA